MNFEQVVQVISRVPVTWLPALLQLLITLCVKVGVFKPGGLKSYCYQCIDRAEKEALENLGKKKVTLV